MSPQWVLTVAHCPDFPNVEDFLSHLSVLLVRIPLITTIVFITKTIKGFFLKEITMIIIIIITITTVMIATKSPGSDRPLWQERTRPGWQGCHKGSHLNHDDHHQHYRDYRDNHYHCHDHNHNHHHASRCSTTPYMTKLATMAILLY